MDSTTYILFKGNKRLTLREDDMIGDKIARIFQVYAPSLYITDDDNVAIFLGLAGHFHCLDLRPRGHYEVNGDDIALPVAEQTPPLSGQNRFQFHRTAQPTAALGSPAQAFAPTPPRASMNNTFQRYPQFHQFRAPTIDWNKAKMRVSTSQLQQLTIFTTMLTGGGISTMYYLLQKKFAESDYHKLAVQELESCPFAMESLGAPPLKVHNIHLTDRNNHVAQHTAQMKIPVSGSRTGGYLYTSSFKDPNTNRWSLKQAVLKLRKGQTIDLLNPPPVASQTSRE